MVSAKGKVAAKKAWHKRRVRYGPDGLSSKGEAKIRAANRRRK